MQELCMTLELKGGFVCEFEELDSPVRKLRDAVGVNISISLVINVLVLINIPIYTCLGWRCSW
jgi:hypothetical protein